MSDEFEKIEQEKRIEQQRKDSFYLNSTIIIVLVFVIIIILLFARHRAHRGLIHCLALALHPAIGRAQLRLQRLWHPADPVAEHRDRLGPVSLLDAFHPLGDVTDHHSQIDPVGEGIPGIEFQRHFAVRNRLGRSHLDAIQERARAPCRIAAGTLLDRLDHHHRRRGFGW